MENDNLCTFLLKNCIELSAISKGNENPNCSDLIIFSQRLLPFYYNIPSYFQSGRTDDMYIFYHKFTRKRVLWLTTVNRMHTYYKFFI